MLTTFSRYLFAKAS